MKSSPTLISVGRSAAPVQKVKAVLSNFMKHFLTEQALLDHFKGSLLTRYFLLTFLNIQAGILLVSFNVSCDSIASDVEMKSALCV